jgi:hypothetical protein
MLNKKAIIEGGKLRMVSGFAKAMADRTEDGSARQVGAKTSEHEEEKDEEDCEDEKFIRVNPSKSDPRTLKKHESGTKRQNWTPAHARPAGTGGDGLNC